MCGTDSYFVLSFVNLDGSYSSTESVLSVGTQVGKEEPPLERIVFCNIDRGIVALAELPPRFRFPHFVLHGDLHRCLKSHRAWCSFVDLHCSGACARIGEV